MIKLLILRFFKILKSLIILFLTLIIKFIKTFSYIVLIKKYYSYFKIIFDTLKKFNHYYIFKYFIKSLAIFNIMLAGFTIFILTDFQYHDYISLLEHNFFNLNINDFFSKIVNYIKRIYKIINDLFSIDVTENNILDKKQNLDMEIPIENKIRKGLSYYIFNIITFGILSYITYKNIDFTTISTIITSFFSGFFSSLFRRDGDPDMPDTDDLLSGSISDMKDTGDITISDNRTNKDQIPSSSIPSTSSSSTIPVSNDSKSLPGSYPTYAPYDPVPKLSNDGNVFILKGKVKKATEFLSPF